MPALNTSGGVPDACVQRFRSTSVALPSWTDCVVCSRAIFVGAVSVAIAGTITTKLYECMTNIQPIGKTAPDRLSFR